MIFDMPNNNINSHPNQNYFGSSPFSYNDSTKDNTFSIFQNDQINRIKVDSMNNDVNEDDEKILDPLKPQKHFEAGKKIIIKIEKT